MGIKRWVRHQWDRATAVVIALGGLAALVLGLVGVARAQLATQQIPYVASGGLVGLFLLGIAATLWLSADLRDEWRKLDDIHQQLRSARDYGEDVTDDAASNRADPADWTSGGRGGPAPRSQPPTGDRR